MFNVFFASRCFRFVLSLASFSALLDLNVVQIDLAWFSFVSSCSIGYFKLF